MKENKKHNIKIGNVTGDVIISQNQKGGTTSHDSSPIKPIEDKKTFFKNKYVKIIGFIAAILGILAFFGIQPTNSTKSEFNKKNKFIAENSTLPVMDTIHSQEKNAINKKDTITKPKTAMKKDEKKTEKPISIGDVSGDVVISQNQTGGVTAHTVNVNTDRNISQTVSNAISNALKNSNCQITVGALGMGGETDKLANQLLIAAQNSGCPTKGVFHGVGFEGFNGLQIQVSQTNPLFGIARSLESILKDASIECIVVYGQNLTEGNIYLYVGYKP